MADFTFEDAENVLKQLGLVQGEKETEAIKSAIDMLSEIDVSDSISAENTLKEIIALTRVYYGILKKQPNNQIAINRVFELVQMKVKITGLINLKPETQDFIDNELNVYKRRIIELLYKHTGKEKTDTICGILAKEGL